MSTSGFSVFARTDIFGTPDSYECQRENDNAAPNVDVDTNNVRVAEAGLAVGLAAALITAARNAEGAKQCLAARGWERISN